MSTNGNAPTSRWRASFPGFSRWLNLIRIFAIVTGGLLLAVGLFANQLGLDSSPSLGRGELLFITVGVIVLAISLAGKHFPSLYRATGLILLNTIILFILIELAATVVVSFADSVLDENRDVYAFYRTLPYYENKPWADSFWAEFAEVIEVSYAPYVVWRNKPYSGEHININDNGFRVAAETHCNSDSVLIYVFGGSTMWGWGAPDWGTIPAYLQAELRQFTAEPVCIINFADNGYVSTQSRILLEQELLAGNVPDLVIFYDGVNEILAAQQSKQPLIHQNLLEISAQFESTGNPIRQWLFSLNSTQLMFRILPEGVRPGAESERLGSEEIAQLADEVVAGYLENERIVGLLAEAYDFEYIFFWQPHILTGNKVLTLSEQRIIDEVDSTWTLTLDADILQLFADSYDKVSLESASRVHLVDISNALDDSDSDLWIDTWGHLTPEGNLIIAETMVMHLVEAEAALEPTKRVFSSR